MKSKELKKQIQAVEKEVARLKAQGWSKKDFALALKNLLLGDTRETLDNRRHHP